MQKTVSRLLIFLLLFTMIIIFLSGCKKETIEATSPSFNYFPTEQGTWTIYDVDSTYHSESDNDNDDSVYYYHFQIKEEIDSTFLDGEGRSTQVISRYKRPDENSDWSLTNVWTQVLSTRSAYRTENNIPFHKLSFPISGIISWNGNDANTMEEEIYTYEYFHEAGSMNSMDFDSTLSVIQIDENNYVEKIFGKEIYANGVGLIYKERDDLGKHNGVVVKGQEYRMSLKEYGKQ